MAHTMQNKVVLLFGAGASKGATHILPYDPPLGIEVYDRLAECFPKEWGPGSQLSRYSEGLRQNFEKTMFDEVCFWNPSLSILEWQRSMALYFSRFTPEPAGEDLYSKLLLFLRDRGKIRDVVFASVNYDCIFEQAAYRLGLQVDYSGGEARENVIRVLKVHGSCNFITENIERLRPYLKSSNSAIECKIDYLQPVGIEQVLTSKFSNPYAPYYPVMSLYSFGKNSIVAGGKIQEIRNAWYQYVLNTSLVAIIGVSPNKDDSHIWKPMQDTSAKLFYIGSQCHFKKWQVANPNFKYVGERFNEAFDSFLGLLH